MAANSTNLISDIKSVISRGPQGTTATNAVDPAHPMLDYVGMCDQILLKFEEAQRLLSNAYAKGMIQVTAAGDSANLALLTGVYNLLTGGGSPSTTARADILTVYNANIASMNTTTQTNVSQATGPIMDYIGNLKILERLFQEVYVMLGSAYQKGMLYDTDSGGDTTNYNLLLGIQQVL